jgi:hypothetical protein
MGFAVWLSLLSFAGVSAQAQIAVIHSGSDKSSEIRVYHGPGERRGPEGEIVSDIGTVYELWDNFSGNMKMKKYLGCRGAFPYWDTELSKQKNKLNNQGNWIALVDVAGAVTGLCLASGVDCLNFLGLQVRDVAKTMGVAKNIFGSNFVTRLTGVTILGGIVSGFMKGLTDFLNPWIRWNKAKAVTVVWEFRGMGNIDGPQYEFRTDLNSFADLISEGLCDIDRDRRSGRMVLRGH